MLRVLQLTDTHVVAAAAPPATMAGAVASLQGATTTETLAAVIAEVTAAIGALDLVLHTGDVADDGEPASYVIACDLLASLGAPVLAVAGNHDDPVALADAFGDELAAVRWRDVGAWRVVAVNTAVREQDHGSLDDDALVAFEAALAGAPGPVLVGLHHPPITVCPDPGCRLEQAAEVLDAIGRHPSVRAVVSGHLHVTEELERDGVAFLLSPSTCLQLRHQHPLPEHNVESTPIGARLLELRDDGTVASRVIWAACP